MPVLRETRNRREATRSVSSRFCKLNLICSSRRLPSTPHLARWQRAKHDRFRPLCRPRSVPIGALLQLRRIWPPVIRLYQCANRRRSGPRPWCKPCTLFRGSRSARSAGRPHNVRGFMLQQADHGLGSQCVPRKYVHGTPSAPVVPATVCVRAQPQIQGAHLHLEGLSRVQICILRGRLLTEHGRGGCAAAAQKHASVTVAMPSASVSERRRRVVRTLKHSVRFRYGRCHIGRFTHGAQGGEWTRFMHGDSSAIIRALAHC